METTLVLMMEADMEDLTLESLARRAEALEQTVASQGVPTKRRD